jgi:hypothetical protein
VAGQRRVGAAIRGKREEGARDRVRRSEATLNAKRAELRRGRHDAARPVSRRRWEGEEGRA